MNATFSTHRPASSRFAGTATRSGLCALTAVLLCSCQSFTTTKTNSVLKGGESAKVAAVETRAVTKAAPAPTQPQPANHSAPPTNPAKGAGVESPGSQPTPANPAGPISIHAGEPCPHCQPSSAGRAGWGGGRRFQPAVGANCWACAPEGLAGEFVRPPEEEYVCNGGDQNVWVQVKQDWSVQGLHSGDTVVHYDTVAGQTVVQPSNQVCLYAPRFASVRKVYGVVAHEQHDRVAGVEAPVGLELSTDRGEPTTVTQPLQPIRRHTVTSMQAVREKTRGIGMDNSQRPALTEDTFLPFEDLAIIRRGVFDNAEKARLSQRMLAAVAWTHGQGPQVMLDNRLAVEATGTNGTESVYTYELPPGKSRLRVVKIASKQNAKPGEMVEFTLRIDNVGDQVLGNVTVIDRLHDRLEYVTESQRCSLKADFLTEDDLGSPRTLRWEITDPIPVGKGGLIRFTCRVR